MTDVTGRPNAGRQTAGPRTLGYGRGDAAPGADAGVAGGIATLGTDGYLLSAQRPPSGNVAAVYRSVGGTVRGVLASTFAAGAYVLTPSGLVAIASDGANAGLFYFDPAFYAITSLTTKLQLRAWFMNHRTVAPGTTTLAFALVKYNGQVSNSGLSAGAALSPSPLAAPTLDPLNAANGNGWGGSTDTTVPSTAGLHFIKVTTNQVIATGSQIEVGAQLLLRNT